MATQMAIQIAVAAAADAASLAAVAARTFPLACPPTSSPGDIAQFVAAHLGPDSFAEYLADPARVLLAARTGDPEAIVGYAMLVHGMSTDGISTGISTDDEDVRRAVPIRLATELSKLYVLADHHGSGAAAALMDAALAAARHAGAGCVWLGVNQHNHRAQRFYGKHGFVVSGTKTFQVGTQVEHDYVLVRAPA